MIRIYLDNCCYNRPFDDQKQLRIRIETEAKLGVQEMILQKTVQLAWSYIIDFENELNPFESRKIMVHQWKNQAAVDTEETHEIVGKAEELVHLGLKSKDALHLACALALGCDYFLTTDDQLLKKTANLGEIKVTDPMTFIREVSE